MSGHGRTMRAVRYLGQAGVMVEDVPIPALVAGEVLIRPAYTGICGTDVHVSHGLHPRVRPPVVLGHEFVGTVQESLSPDWRPGQRVAVEPLRTCGRCTACAGPHYNRCRQLQILGIDIDGSLADLVAVPAQRLLELPAEVPDRSAALVEPLAVAVHAVAALGALSGSDPVLVFGGGPIGWLAAEVLRADGHQAHVAEVNGFRREMIRDAGHHLAELGSTGDTTGPFQAGLEASGTGVGLSILTDRVGPGGSICVVGLPKRANELDAMQVISKELTLRGSRVYTRGDFVRALELLGDRGETIERLVTHEIGLEDVVSGGLHRIEEGGPVGKILVRGSAT